jgi:hypothetical protein
MLQGALRLPRGGGTEDAFQPLVHLAHAIGGGCMVCVQKRGRRNHVLAGPGEGDSTHPPLNDMQRTSSKSIMGSEWFED